MIWPKRYLSSLLKGFQTREIFIYIIMMAIRFMMAQTRINFNSQLPIEVWAYVDRQFGCQSDCNVQPLPLLPAERDDAG